jgi:hypothetical protein
MKSTIMLDVTPCSLVEVYRRFGRTYCLHLQNLKVSQASRKQRLLAGLIYDRDNGDGTLLRNVSRSLRNYTASHSKRWFSYENAIQDLCKFFHSFIPCSPPPPRSNALPSTLFRNTLYLRVYAYCITCENYGFIYRRTWCSSEVLW